MVVAFAVVLFFGVPVVAGALSALMRRRFGIPWRFGLLIGWWLALLALLDAFSVLVAAGAVRATSTGTLPTWTYPLGLLFFHAVLAGFFVAVRRWQSEGIRHQPTSTVRPRSSAATPEQLSSDSDALPPISEPTRPPLAIIERFPSRAWAYDDRLVVKRAFEPELEIPYEQISSWFYSMGNIWVGYSANGHPGQLACLRVGRRSQEVKAFEDVLLARIPDAEY